MRLADFYIDFKHSPEGTECQVKTLDETQISHSLAKKHPNDTFNKAKGRVVALTKAIKGFSREIRTAIWKDYKNSCNLVTQ